MTFRMKPKTSRRDWERLAKDYHMFGMRAIAEFGKIHVMLSRQVDRPLVKLQPKLRRILDDVLVITGSYCHPEAIKEEPKEILNAEPSPHKDTPPPLPVSGK